MSLVTNAIDTGFSLEYSVGGAQLKDLNFLGVKVEMSYFSTDKL